jgi:hypothetical protein
VRRKPKVIRWLESYARDFKRLRPKERRAIADFSLLWMFFEADAFRGETDQGRIRDFADKVCRAGFASDPTFLDALVYYRARYWPGAENHHFGCLDPHARLSAVNRQILIDALSDPDAPPQTALRGLFLVVFRLRNNLFHGEKATYGFADQHDNLTKASAVLMHALELLQLKPALAA